jgi:hypothetical protein
MYMVVPIALLLGLTAAVAWFRSRYGAGVDPEGAGDN